MSIQEIILNSLTALQSDGDIRGVMQHIINAGVGKTHEHEGWLPPVDIIDTSTHLSVLIELAGVSQESISIDFFNNKLTVSGERIKTYKTPFFKNEIIYGNFKRTIILPVSVTNQKNVIVSYDKGMLSLFIDKTKEEQNRFKIGVNS